jgi:hypothetical protein
MPGRLGPRFAIEVLFLIALAVGAAYADLDAKWIALIMAGGWIVVALLELTAERIWAAVPPWRRPNYYAPAVVAPPEPVPVDDPEPEPEAVAVEAVVEPPPPEPEPEPEPEFEPEPATIVVPPTRAEAVVEPEPEAKPEDDAEPDSEPEPAEESKRPRLEPLQPPPKRRWFRRRADVEPAETPPPELPKHVRLLPPPPRAHSDDEIAEIMDGAEHERRA